MNKNIFFIGPAGVGKTTVGNLVAIRLDYKFVDIDKEFCERIALIPNYIDTNGYPAYCEADSKLVDDLLLESPGNTVFATPSGFLVHENLDHLIKKHLDLISTGISVLLLPSEDIEEATKIVLDRQLKRWNDTSAEIEEQRFRNRFPKYKQYGDIKIFSSDPPEKIAEAIVSHF